MDFTKADLDKLVAHCKCNLPLGNSEDHEAYLYTCVPLCVMDAVFSINANYKAAENVVDRFCKHASIERKRDKKTPVAQYPCDKQLATSTFLERYKQYSPQKMAKDVYVNRNVAAGGMLKAEAVFRFCGVLKKYGYEYLHQALAMSKDDKARKDFDADIHAIKGQKNAVTSYFYMLVGNKDYIKVDRMLERFTEAAIGRKLCPDCYQAIYRRLFRLLKKDFPNLKSMRQLDGLIWAYQREVDKKNKKKK